MPHYLTRHLEAKTELSHGDVLVRSGERFYATPVDADYYVSKNKAVDVKDEPAKTPAAKPAAAPAAKKVETAKPATAAPRQSARPAESMLTTSRDLPGPSQDAAKPTEVPTEAKPDAAA